jgi:hypothetical protein
MKSGNIINVKVEDTDTKAKEVSDFYLKHLPKKLDQISISNFETDNGEKIAIMFNEVEAVKRFEKR